MNALSRSLAAFACGDLIHWAGLPADLTLDEVARFWSVSPDDEYDGQLGDAGIEARYVWLDTTYFAGGLRLWVTEQPQGRSVVAIEGRQPRSPDDLPVAAPDLGPPEAQAPARLGLIEFDHGERIYATRGLAVRVNPDTGNILGVIGYAPTRVADYLSHLCPLQSAPRPLVSGRST